MRSTHLTVVVFCHILLASIVFYFTSFAIASPLAGDNTHKQQIELKRHQQPTTHTHKLAKSLEQKRPQQVVPAEQQQKAPVALKTDNIKLDSKSASNHASPVVVVAAAHTDVKQNSVATPLESSSSVKQVSDQSVAVPVVISKEPIKSVELHQEQAFAHPTNVSKLASPSEQPIVALPTTKNVAEQSPKVVVAEQSVPAPEKLISTSPIEAAPKVVPVASDTEQVQKVHAPVVPNVARADIELTNQQIQPEEGRKQQVVAQQPAIVVVPLMAQQVPVAAPEVVQQPVVQAASAVAPTNPVTVVEAPSKVIVEEHVSAQRAAPAPVVVVIEKKVVEEKKQETSGVTIDKSPSNPLDQTSHAKVAQPTPVVKGGLGPLHLLATTLCSYQPDKQVADENLNQLYGRRASVRKSLFEFMSLKFTNLEKLSSRLGYGLQVVPVASSLDGKSPSVAPSHGWPVVGKCTAHDLKLMGEAAWCECNETDQECLGKQTQQQQQEKKANDEQSPAKVAGSQPHTKSARSIDSMSFLPSPEESSVISKLLHVTDMKDAPTVESTIYNLNLTQHQLATLEAHATSTQECRRNALRYTKALFNHLAEDQTSVSDSWPKLYALISADDCARKRMIDIVNALSSFRTDTTSIRRDNLEFAFAMDDLRAKVLESEVNVPLTFDRHFIEVEQFLQQSVRLMLANIQPKRAKLTSMRYRSLMYGTSQQAADDQCIDLHQRLLARNYPNDCNPTQFGQLPDVLRMTASSLELWSIEKELSLHTAKIVDYPNSSAVGQQKVKEDVNECIANLVAS